MKPRIFIGSSVEGLPVARYLAQKLKGEAEPLLWNSQIDDFNKSTLDILLHQSILYDFGILVATRDDLQRMRDQLFEVARDNVILEFGIFLGRLEKNHVFFLHDEKIKMPSDLRGINMPRFRWNGKKPEWKGMKQAIQSIKKKIGEYRGNTRLSLMPSTALAIGYYYNFIMPILDILKNKKSITFKKVRFNRFVVNIVLPHAIDSDIKAQADAYYDTMQLGKLALNSEGRKYPVHVSASASPGGQLHIYDMPTTLLSIDKAIEIYSGDKLMKSTRDKELLEAREILNFQRTLEHLIRRDALARSVVHVIYNHAMTTRKTVTSSGVIRIITKKSPVRQIIR